MPTNYVYLAQGQEQHAIKHRKRHLTHFKIQDFLPYNPRFSYLCKQKTHNDIATFPQPIPLPLYEPLHHHRCHHCLPRARHLCMGTAGPACFGHPGTYHADHGMHTLHTGLPHLAISPYRYPYWHHSTIHHHAHHGMDASTTFSPGRIHDGRYHTCRLQPWRSEQQSHELPMQRRCSI